MGQSNGNAVGILRAVSILLCCMLLTVGLESALAGQTGLREVAAKLVQDMVSDADVAKLKGEKIVVAEFENINGKGDAVPRILQEMLTTAFIKDKHFKVVERAQLEKALRELQISSSGLIDPDNAKKIGKMLGAGYMVMGSISETSGEVSIDARIVSIESGESVTAADATVSGAGGTSSAAPNAKPQVDLTQQANTNSAGQTVGSVENFGLLGGTKFKVAWRESLGSTPIYAFASGDVTGDGVPRLMALSELGTDGSSLVVFKWLNGAFKRTWTDAGLFTSFRGPQHLYLHVLRPTSGGNWICASSDSEGSRVWKWDGTNYASSSVGGWWVVMYTDTAKPTRIVGLKKNLDDYPHLFLSEVSLDGKGLPNWAESEKPAQRWVGWHESTCVATDLDGDGKMEFAVVESTDSAEGKPIEFLALDGTRKSVTANGYGCRLSVWRPGSLKTPYLVARKTSKDENGKPDGGYIYFLQWNGETYEEAWKSNKLDDRVVDIQVCDPKGEGKDGLVVLTADKKDNMYLTKIVSD